MRIWKYDIVADGREFTRLIPAGGRILTVQLQRDTPVMWVAVGPHPHSSMREERRFAAVGTGHDIPDGAVYLGTFQLYGGDLVVHLVETTNAA